MVEDDLQTPRFVVIFGRLYCSPLFGPISRQITDSYLSLPHREISHGRRRRQSKAEREQLIKSGLQRGLATCCWAATKGYSQRVVRIVRVGYKRIEEVQQ